MELSGCTTYSATDQWQHSRRATMNTCSALFGHRSGPQCSSQHQIMALSTSSTWCSQSKSRPTRYRTSKAQFLLGESWPKRLPSVFASTRAKETFSLLAITTEQRRFSNWTTACLMRKKMNLKFWRVTWNRKVLSEVIIIILILHNLKSSVLASCLHQAVLRHNLLEIKNNLNRLWDHFHMNEFSEFETFAINVEVLLF